MWKMPILHAVYGDFESSIGFAKPSGVYASCRESQGGTFAKILQIMIVLYHPKGTYSISRI